MVESFLQNYFNGNSTLSEEIFIYLDTVFIYLSKAISFLNNQQSAGATFEIFPDFFSFNDFYYQLLKGFILLLVVNLCLLVVAWRIFGNRICEQFMSPVTPNAIEELKASVSKLKLPKEHTPRI